MGYDFSGWASKNNIRCGDGRTIRQGAFANDNGKTVPLVYMHDHKDINNVLGTATLENRPEGMYVYGKFNNTAEGQRAKELVRDGNLDRLSIFANHLQQRGGDVLHGEIKEVSLVLAGANPGAVIENPIIQHSDGSFEDCEEEAIIIMPDNINLSHADKEGDTKVANNQEINNVPQDQNGREETVADVFNTLSDKQKEVVYYLIGAALDNKNGGGAEAAQSDFYYDNDYYYDGGYDLKHNAFDDGDYMYGDGGFELSHDDLQEIMKNARREGSLKHGLEDFALEHADDYGIKDIDILFPDAQTITNSPDFIKRETEWVGKVMNGTKHSPFSRVKTIFADITADEARAKGYIKGKRKKEEVFTLLKRTTDPQTIYKKQKLDRDDVTDITDFDVIAYIKGEMRVMLDEEIARAILVGDGRLASDDDHISEDHIRPVATDDDLYTIKVQAKGADIDEVAKNFIDEYVIACDDYKGSGNVTMFIAQKLYTRLLLLKDGQGYRLYKSPNELATALTVNNIQPVPNEIFGDKYYAVALDLSDYNVGADKGGSVSMFDDFDIDYNQMKYLIETRCSGALIKPYSAIVMKPQAASESAQG